MTAARRRLGRIAGGALAALAGACQPLPQPFIDDKPSADLISVPNSTGIAVGEFAGEPHTVADKLAAAITKELLNREIPASDRTTSVGSYRLDGHIEEGTVRQGQATLTVFWRLRNPAGQIVVERSDELQAAVADWTKGSDDKIAQLAALGAGGLAGFVTSDAPKQEQAAGSGRIRILLRKVSGAPGDGNTSLASAVAAVLKREDLDIAEKPGDKADLDLDAAITVDPAKANAQHVKIVWHVARAGGAEIGTVAQENDVPRGRLDGAWGDIAYNVAIAAEGGILELVSRGAPPLKVTAGVPLPSTTDTAPAPPASSAAPSAAAPIPPGSPANPSAAAKPAPPAAALLAPIPAMNPPAAIGTPAPIPFRGVPLPQ
jgi:hypothetical protein